VIYDLAANHTQMFVLSGAVNGLTLGIVLRWLRLVRARKRR